ncbi:hypothetical protein M0657_003411 [Pyricularia oryzae]|nr:hypothetical protein M9X92_003053 [Pyricularia oryzae]KAI7927147.1 hypothetical protein M0657_003411 [Pyricularia oryzae]
MFPLWMVTWKFFDGEKARGASTAKCNAFFPSRRYSFCVVVSEVDYISRCVLAAYLPPSPLDAVKVVRSSVTTQDNDKKVRVRLKVGKRWEGVGGGVCVGKGRREREKGEKEEEKRILLEWRQRLGSRTKRNRRDWLAYMCMRACGRAGGRACVNPGVIIL